MTKNTNGLQKRQKPRDLPRTQAVEQEKEKNGDKNHDQKSLKNWETK